MAAMPLLNRSRIVRLMSGVYVLGSSPIAAAHHDRSKDQQQARRETETGPFDLLPGNSGRLPPEADELADEDGSRSQTATMPCKSSSMSRIETMIAPAGCRPG